VDDLAVTRRCNGADSFGRFEDDDLAAGLRQPARDRKTDHAGTDYDALNFFHFAVRIRAWLADFRSGTGELTPRPGSIAFAPYRIVLDDFSWKTPDLPATDF
jgi:hypothetical protein